MRKVLLMLAAFTMMTTACTTNQQTTGIDLANLDTTAVPQNDFYQFACGGWMANNPLTPEYSRFGSFDKLGLNNLEQVNGLIQEIAAKNHAQGSIAQKIGDIYNLAMDTARRDQEGIEPVRKTLQEIEGITSRDQLSKVLGAAMDIQLWAMYVDADAMNSSMNILNEYQAGFALGEKEYYLDEDEQTLIYKRDIRCMCKLYLIRYLIIARTHAEHDHMMFSFCYLLNIYITKVEVLYCIIVRRTNIKIIRFLDLCECFKFSSLCEPCVNRQYHYCKGQQ